MSNRKLVIRAALGMVAGLGIATSSWGGTAQATFNVTATVAQKCTITATDVVFGAYDPVVTNLSTALDAPSPGTLVVTCTKNSGTPAIILDLNFGNNSTGGINRRMLESGGAGMFLTYQLYQASTTAVGAGCTYPGAIVWGDGTNGSRLTPSGTAGWGNAAPKTLNVCGSVTAGQDVEPGSYADITTATVNF